MIKSAELIEIGQFLKPHGIKGELSAIFNFPEVEPDMFRCLIIEINGIYVPFFIDTWREKGGTSYLIKLDGVNNESEAQEFSNYPFFILKSDLPEENLAEIEDGDGFYLYDLIGYKIFDDKTPVGIINDIDDSTSNILLHIKKDNDIIYVPFAEDWIEEFDAQKHIIRMNIPNGVINLNSK